MTIATPRLGGWIGTFSGGHFYPMDPRETEVNLLDIAHSLSMQCRFTGHTTQFYSVAQHCCLMHDAALPHDRLQALMHDASEAYLTDVPSPIKPFLAGYKVMEDRVQKVICARYGLDYPAPMTVKVLDQRILLDEKAALMRDQQTAWGLTGEPLGVVIEEWPPSRAKREFMARAWPLIEKETPCAL